MKKFLTLSVAILASFSLFAQTVQVTLTNNTNYDVQIDGSRIDGSRTLNLNAGQHTVNVFRVDKAGILGVGMEKTLLSSQQFTVNTSPVRINITSDGKAQISGASGTRGDRGNGKDRGKYKHNEDNDDNQGDNRNRGRGNKNGHHKNAKTYGKDHHSK